MALPGLHVTANTLRSYALCGHGALLGINPTTKAAVVIPMTCKSWSCHRCRPIKSLKWQHIANAGMPERLITLTCDHKRFRNPYEAMDHMLKAWPKLLTLIRKKFGSFEYLKVWELHKSGYPHIHMMQRGKFIPQKWLSAAWDRLGCGSIVDIRKIYKQDCAGKYLVKYLGKSFAELSSLWYRKRLISKSNGWIIRKDEKPPGKDTTGFEWKMILNPYWRVVSDLASIGAEPVDRNLLTFSIDLDLQSVRPANLTKGDATLPTAWIHDKLEPG